MNEEVKNAKESKDGISLVKKYEDLLKGANKKIINIVGKQGELLKRFKYSDESFDCVGLSRSNIYFKISLYKFLCKFPVFKNSTLTSSFFKSSFKLIKRGKFKHIWWEKVKIFVPLFFIFFILVWIILSSLESFICTEFYLWKILSSLDNFIDWKSY